MIIFGLICLEYLRVYLLHRKEPLYRAAESTIIVLFVMITIYAVFSGGRFTRSFAFYVIMGYAVGYLSFSPGLDRTTIIRSSFSDRSLPVHQLTGPFCDQSI